MKYIVEINANGLLENAESSSNGTYIDAKGLQKYEETSANIVIQLVKQGVTAEEIIKLKNADLL